MSAPIARDLRVEHHDEPIGIGEPSPRISWRQVTVQGGVDAQLAYEIEVTRDASVETITTGRVIGGDTAWLTWPFEPLRSRERAILRVRLWGALDAEPGDWSAPLVVEAGLLARSDWQSDLVSPTLAVNDNGPRPALLLRADFELDGPIDRARVYATAQGVFRLFVNGHPVGDDVLAPGWTSYDHRLRYRTHDIAALLRPGTNVIAAELADGWFRGRLGFNGGLWNNYGDHVALLTQLEVIQSAGEPRVVDLAGRWQWSRGPVTSSGLYEGEERDARLEVEGWRTSTELSDGWGVASTIPLDQLGAELVAPTGPPVRVIEELAPVSVEQLGDGRYLLDFGQNIAGKLRIRPRGDAGHTVTLRHAEVLDDGELALRPLRSAGSVDRYTLAGTGEPEEWSPDFTLHGFRFAEVEHWPGEMAHGDVVALLVHSDMRRTGWFSSSHELVNRLHENVVWSMRDNFVDIPTDCPQRDERLGWTGDIQVFGETASFLYSSGGLLSGWLRDVAAEQIEYGTVPNFVPWIECGFSREATAAWGDVAVILPWKIYQRTGDVAVLRAQFSSARHWVDQIASLTAHTGLWGSGPQLGDWLDPAAPSDRPDAGRTDRYLVATAYHAHSAGLLARMAAVLGDDAAAAHYGKVAETARRAFRQEFIAPSGRLVSDTETAISLAICFELFENEAQRVVAGRRLVELVEESGYVIRTGFVGTPLICDALALTGAHDTAYKLLVQTENPSWLYPVTMGATTVWERWDSLLPDGSVNPGEMTSFNHYALGAVADFLHRVVAGLAPGAPGYREIVVAPVPGGGLTSASARLDSPYGESIVEWRRDGTEFHLEVTVPLGVTARVEVPSVSGARSHLVGGGVHRFEAEVRAADDDPRPERPYNPHNPEERALRV